MPKTEGKGIEPIALQERGPLLDPSRAIDLLVINSRLPEGFRASFHTHQGHTTSLPLQVTLMHLASICDIHAGRGEDA